MKTERSWSVLTGIKLFALAVSCDVVKFFIQRNWYLMAEHFWYLILIALIYFRVNFIMRVVEKIEEKIASTQTPPTGGN